MKTLRLLMFGFALMLATSCNGFLPDAENPDLLSLTLEIIHDEKSSFESFRAHITLKNESDTDFLVHNRLVALPWSSPINEVTILIKDYFGNLLSWDYTIRYQMPSKDTLNRLRPGYSVTNDFVFSDWSSSRKYNIGDQYTIVAVYRNDIEYTETIEGRLVSAWIGEIYSNEEMFVILPSEE